MYDWLAHTLSSGDVVVTATGRLARELRQAHSESQRRAGHQAWLSPAIEPLAVWLRRCLDELDPRSVPSHIPARASSVLWERVIAQHLGQELPARDGLVRQCQQAWTRLHDWCVPLREVTAAAHGPEQRQFAAAAEAYQRALEQQGWVDDATLISVIGDALTAGRLQAPDGIKLCGFDRLSPALQHLIQALGDAGCRVSDARDAGTARVSLQTPHAGSDAELRAAGAWARSQLMADPRQRVAILRANLEQDAGNVVRLIREGFACGWQCGGLRHRDAVHLSYGGLLSDYPAVRIALLLLRWVFGELGSRDVSLLLRTRLIDGGPSAGRARTELRLRQLPDRPWSPGSLLRALRPPAAESGNTEHGMGWIQAVVEAREDNSAPRRLSHWAEQFDILLTAVGWPGRGALQSDEYQVLDRWRELLNELAGLDMVVAPLSFSDAVARLAAMASQTVFQPEARDAALPVLGALEAAGMQFDKLLVTGFDAGHWPSPANPLALVSRQLQKQRQMPDATAADALDFSRRVLRRLVANAREIVFSWARTTSDIAQVVSPLAGELAADTAEHFADPGWHAGGLLRNAALSSPSAGQVPPIADGTRIRGGAYTVQRQATDPFAGFAFGRLGVADHPRFQPGLSARQRGRIMHDALHRLYADRPSQESVRRWTDLEFAARSDAAANRALRRYRQHADSVLRRLLDLERERVIRLLGDLRVHEMTRQPFVVERVEDELEFSRFGLVLAVRLDRVDRLDDDRLLIVDYKTGMEKSLMTAQHELRDLQLAVYAMALGESIGGLALYNIDSRKISMKSTLGDADWPATLDAWCSDANAALKGLADGDARVNTLLGSAQGRLLNVLSRFEDLRRGR